MKEEILNLPETIENAIVTIGTAGSSIMFDNDKPFTVQSIMFLAPRDINIELSNGEFVDVNTLCEFYENAHEPHYL